MKCKFKIRKARKEDKPLVKELLARSVANRKSLFSSETVTSQYINELVNRSIDHGDLLVVENEQNELELIGEVHYYYNQQVSGIDTSLRELSFISKIDRGSSEVCNELIDWLYNEIENKHPDVFSVEVMAPVANQDSINGYIEKGIRVESNYSGRLVGNPEGYSTFLPLTWINPSFN